MAATPDNGGRTMSDVKQIEATAMKISEIVEDLPGSIAVCAVAVVLAAIGCEWDLSRDVLIDALDTARNRMLQRKSNG
jgi:hypothetical protein